MLEVFTGSSYQEEITCLRNAVPDEKSNYLVFLLKPEKKTVPGTGTKNRVLISNPVSAITYTIPTGMIKINDNSSLSIRIHHP